jgi:hypothetical protein
MLGSGAQAKAIRVSPLPHGMLKTPELHETEIDVIDYATEIMPPAKCHQDYVKRVMIGFGAVFSSDVALASPPPTFPFIPLPYHLSSSLPPLFQRGFASITPGKFLNLQMHVGEFRRILDTKFNA